MLTVDDLATFSWGFSDKFFLETDKGNFIWSDPDYNGDNTIRPYKGTLEDFLKEEDISYCRDKGSHIIKEYCGDDVTII